MKAIQRFNLVTTLLSCITCAGATVVFVALDRHLETPMPTEPPSQQLRPSLAAAPEAVSAWTTDTVSEEAEADTSARLAFVPDGPEIFDHGDESETSVDIPDAWSVEVTEQPAAGGRAARSAGQTNINRARRIAEARRSLKQRLAEISPAATERLVSRFKSAKAVWPPTEIALVAIKDEKALELHARQKDGAWSFVHRYKVLAASGSSGPKLQRGDRQVPEGVYAITYLNPNSAYHVSLRVNYPNAFDRKMAAKEGRKDLGGDIMIHGKNLSAGCLAVGDSAVEELFVLAAEVGTRNVRLVIAPTDFRRGEATAAAKGPEWLPGLYAEIASAMSDYKAPQQPSLLSLLGFGS